MRARPKEWRTGRCECEMDDNTGSKFIDAGDTHRVEAH